MGTTTGRSLHVVQQLAMLAKKLEGSKLKSNLLITIDEDLKEIGRYMVITENQALIFTVLFNLQMNDTRDLCMYDMARYLDVNYIDLILYKSDIDALIERRYLKTTGANRKSMVPFKGISFSINKGILESIFMNSTITEPKPEKEMDVCSFVQNVSNMIEQRSKEEIDTYDLFIEVDILESANLNLEVIQKLKALDLKVEDRILFYEVSDDFRKGGRSDINQTMNDIYDELNDRFYKIREIKEEKHPLCEKGLIKLTEAGFMSDAKIDLTEKGLELFMGENAKLFMKKNDKNLIQADKIADKELFYDSALEKQVRFFQESLQAEKFVSMQRRLEEMSMPKGIAAIFYGEPGTGKTETVYQLAKETGRAIMHVDISQSKSMWFGESEKKIKEIFTNYAALCRNCDLKPILLFNEADAVFGKRKDTNASNVAQTENAIQNIILEEMEKLDGILIATTNLNQNLDGAFERRFLFKIKFEKPSLEAKQKIWQSKLAWLSEQDASTLATEYSFSGGEIDNIVRKVIMEEVLKGERPAFEEITGYCDSEKFTNKSGNKRLGF